MKCPISPTQIPFTRSKWHYYSRKKHITAVTIQYASLKMQIFNRDLSKNFKIRNLNHSKGKLVQKGMQNTITLHSTCSEKSWKTIGHERWNRPKSLCIGGLSQSYSLQRVITGWHNYVGSVFKDPNLDISYKNVQNYIAHTMPVDATNIIRTLLLLFFQPGTHPLWLDW